MALAMLSHSQLPRHWWAEAANTAVYTLNNIVHRANDQKTPYELFTGHRSSLAKMRVFDYKAWSLMQKPESRDKQQLKGRPCIFLGYSATSKVSTCDFLKRNYAVTRSTMVATKTKTAMMTTKTHQQKPRKTKKPKELPMTKLPQAKGSQHLELDPLWNDNSQRLRLPPNVPRPTSHDLQVDFPKQTSP